jgi:hypothetical protein
MYLLSCILKIHYMKNTFTFFNACFLISIMLMMQACPKKTEYNIRFVNQHSKSFKNVTIGGNNIGTVNSGATSDYTKVPDAKGSYSGLATDSSASFSGEYTLTGTGKLRFSLTLSASQQFTITKDQ